MEKSKEEFGNTVANVFNLRKKQVELLDEVQAQINEVDALENEIKNLALNSSNDIG